MRDYTPHLTLIATMLATPARADSPSLAARLAHTHARFELTAKAPFAEVAPLFGALRERAWAPGWNPQFVHPVPAADTRGMVFTVSHGHMDSIWVNTELDLKNGLIQYVYVIPTKMTTLITVRLRAQAHDTRVEVEYERTALTSDANGHVQKLAEQDRASGPEWENQINAYLARKR
jgi:hypothetical protein